MHPDIKKDLGTKVRALKALFIQHANDASEFQKTIRDLFTIISAYNPYFSPSVIQTIIQNEIIQGMPENILTKIQDELIKIGKITLGSAALDNVNSFINFIRYFPQSIQKSIIESVISEEDATAFFEKIEQKIKDFFNNPVKDQRSLLHDATTQLNYLDYIFKAAGKDLAPITTLQELVQTNLEQHLKNQFDKIKQQFPLGDDQLSSMKIELLMIIGSVTENLKNKARQLFHCLQNEYLTYEKEQIREQIEQPFRELENTEFDYFAFQTAYEELSASIDTFPQRLRGSGQNLLNELTQQYLRNQASSVINEALPDNPNSLIIYSNIVYFYANQISMDVLNVLNQSLGTFITENGKKLKNNEITVDTFLVSFDKLYDFMQKLNLFIDQFTMNVLKAINTMLTDSNIFETLKNNQKFCTLMAKYASHLPVDATPTLKKQFPQLYQLRAAPIFLDALIKVAAHNTEIMPTLAGSILNSHSQKFCYLPINFFRNTHSKNLAHKLKMQYMSSLSSIDKNFKDTVLTLLIKRRDAINSTAENGINDKDISRKKAAALQLLIDKIQPVNLPSIQALCDIIETWKKAPVATDTNKSNAQLMHDNRSTFKVFQKKDTATDEMFLLLDIALQQAMTHTKKQC